MRLSQRFIAVLLFSTLISVAQQPPINNQSIIKMHSAGLGDDVIVSSISTQPGGYATSVDDLIALKKAGISDKVIAAMISSNGSHGNGTATSSTTSVALQSPSSQTPVPPAGGKEKPRVFLQSSSHGNNRNSERDQSMEMSKDFERDCPSVRVSLNQSMADYTVSLNHIESGFVRDNQFQIADKNGDLISKTKEGGSIAGGIKKVCTVLMADWNSK